MEAPEPAARHAADRPAAEPGKPESAWAQRLREATERLDAVGLPEPKNPDPESEPHVATGG